MTYQKKTHSKFLNVSKSQSALLCVRFTFRKSPSMCQERWPPVDLGLCGPYVHQSKVRILSFRNHVKFFFSVGLHPLLLCP